jgi:peptide/nickel transport system ATP-binding protein/oligopeptide transport system ATP-binding protein
MSDGPILEVRDLRVELPLSRGTVRAVEGASFAVAPGQAFGLVGESGCGKSMTLRAIMGLLPRPGHIVGGQVLFDGEDLVTASAGRLREVRGGSIAMIFQEPMTALNPVMRVGDQIAEAPQVHLGLSRSAARHRALDLMRRVGIPDPTRRARAYPHELSGGLRQRIMIAIALSCDPQLILCDEPTTALDVTIQDQILKLLLNLRREFGVSVVFVTHDLAVVAETGTVDEVFRNPRHPYTLGLLRSVPDFDSVQDSLSSIQGAPPDLVMPPPGCRFHPRCPFAQEDCISGEFPLRPVSADRTTACIHSEACVADVERRPVVADA